MTKPFFIITLILLSFNESFSQTVYPSGVPGCIARWTFDSVDVVTLSSLTDYSGNNHHGTITDVNSSNGFRNTVHAAGNFNGQSSFAQVTQNPNMLCPQNLSVISLIKFNGFNNQLCQGNNIIYNGFNYNNGGGNWAFFVSDMSDCNTYSPQNEILNFQGSNQQNPMNTNNTFIDSNAWYFLATSHNNQSTTYYIEKMDPLVYNSNVQAKYSLFDNNPIGSSTYDVVIGKTNNPPYPFYLNADIDELILFNRDLVQSEIQSIYQYLWGFANALAPNNELNNVNLSWQNQSLWLNDPKNKVQQIELFSLSGACLLQTKADPVIPINRPLSPGIYFARLSTNNGKSIFKKIYITP